MKISVLEALEMAKQLKDKLASLNRTRYTAFASSAIEEAIHWLRNESEAE